MHKEVRKFAPAIVAALLASLLTSGIWITAYYVGVKPNINKHHDHHGSSGEWSTWQTSPPDAPSTPLPQLVDPGPSCDSPCSYALVESMPRGLYDGKKVFRLNSTYDAWRALMDRAEHSLDITAFYWSLLANNTGDGFKWDESAQEGTDIYNEIVKVGARGVRMSVNQDASSALNYAAIESQHLADLGYADVRRLNFSRLVGGGVLHTKSWLSDVKHFYLGSANHDWRALTQIHEIGISMFDCPCLAADLKKIFNAYAYLGVPNAQVPREWPLSYATRYNARTPLPVRLRRADGDAIENIFAYFTSSPPPFVAYGREHDGDSIIRVINAASKFVHISVMDYAPLSFFLKPNTYWPLIDDALRSAAFNRRVHVRLLMSKWQSTRPELFAYLHSLHAISSQLPCTRVKKNGVWGCKDGTRGSIDVKIFEVPPYSTRIPYGRVNHAKFMVTESTAVICTSNWSSDYFLNTGGISMVIEAADESSPLISDLAAVHERDWTSEYATSIERFTDDGTPVDQASE